MQKLSSTMFVLLTALLWASHATAHEGIDEQIQRVTARLKTSPRDASLYLRRGELHRIHRDWTLAAADYRKARKLDPRLLEVDYYLGRMLLEAGKSDEAIVHLHRFLQRRPDHIAALVTSARARAREGHYLAAAADYTKAIQNFRDGAKPRPEHFLERARALRAAGKEHIEAAISGLEVAVRWLGPVPSIEMELLDLEVARGNYDAALTRLDAMTRPANRHYMLARRADLLRQAGRLSESRQAYVAARKAVESLPVRRRGTVAVKRLKTRIELGLSGLQSTDSAKKLDVAKPQGSATDPTTQQRSQS